MEARSSPDLPGGPGWVSEPKWDALRGLAFKRGGEVHLIAKSARSLNRFCLEVVDRLATLSKTWFALDGELLAQDGDAFSFEVLQARLHATGSLIRRLADEHPHQPRRSPRGVLGKQPRNVDAVGGSRRRSTRPPSRSWPPRAPGLDVSLFRVVDLEADRAR